MPRLLPHLRFLACAWAVVLMLGWTGCGDSERFSYASETDEPNYREGQSLLKAGRRQEALSAFLKVIDKRRDDAPESHLEVGLLYAQHINDPLSAIYHFRKYLALRPNSPQAPLVRQRIDAAIRDFARTLPAQPLDGSQLQRVDLVATLDRLKQENEALKQQLADTRAGRGLPPVTATAEQPATAAPANPDALSFTVDTAPTVPTVRTRPLATTTQSRPAVTAPAPVVSTSNASRATPTRPASPLVTAPAASRSTPTVSTRTTPAAPARTTPPAPAASGRKHTVRPGDTLSKLAQQYYNNRAKWRDIYAANRDVMKSESDLKTGMELKIP